MVDKIYGRVVYVPDSLSRLKIGLCLGNRNEAVKAGIYVIFKIIKNIAAALSLLVSAFLSPSLKYISPMNNPKKMCCTS